MSEVELRIDEVGKEDFERNGLGKDGRYLGNHFNNEKRGVVQRDLPTRVKAHVKRHVRHHLLHDKPTRSHRMNEASALFFPAVRDPIGFTAAAAYKLRQEKLNKMR